MTEPLDLPVRDATAGSADAPADAAARARALAADASFIVQAPAGSGKTGLLIQRLLVLLAQVEDPEEIVAITFTRKAAGEIRQRVTEALQSGRDDEAPAEPHARLTWQLARDALANADRRGWDLATQRLQARTIDAFCESIARRLPLLSGHGERRQTIDDARGLFREAIRRVLRSGAPSVQALLWHLDNDVPQFHRLFESLLSHRDQWQRHLGGSAVELRAVLEQSLRAVIDQHVAAVTAAAPPMFRKSAPALLAYAEAQLGREPQPLLFDANGWRRLAQLCLTDRGTVRARVDRRQGFPAAKGAEDPALAKTRKGQIQELLGELGAAEHRPFVTLLAAVKGLPPARYADEQWQLVEALQELLKLLIEELRRVFAEKGQVDHTEVAAAAIRALELRAEHADAFGITHLLVDEFQDTSVAQYRLLTRVTAAWQPADRRTLFLVGDPMQSIYRFREANVELFLHCQREGLGGVAVEPLTLTENFRSAAPLVAAVNDIFSEAFDPAFEGEPGAVPYTPFTAHAGAATGSVALHAWSGDHRRAEAERVADLVQQAQRDGHRTIAVLVRSRHHLDVVLPLLRRRGVRYRAVDFETLSGRTVVRDLQALTEAIASPIDRVAWLSLLRSPWCGLTLRQLTLVAERAPAVFPAHLEEVGEYLDEEAAARVRRVASVLAAAHENRGRGSLRDRVTTAWVHLGAPALLSAAELDEAEQFFGVLDDVANEGELPQPEELAARLADLYARPDPLAGAVEVMTVHRSKGLEFDCVILPGLGRAPRPSESRLLLWDEDAQGSLLLGPMQSRRVKDEDPIYAYLRRGHRSKDLHELRRLLYVACTRARRELHLLAHMAPRDGGDEQPHSGSALSVLGESLQHEFRKEIDRDIAPPEEERPPPPRARRLVGGWSPDPPAATVTAEVPVGTATQAGVSLGVRGGTGGSVEAVAFGTVIHNLLAAVAEGAPVATVLAEAVVCAALLREGCRREALATVAAEVQATVEGVLADERGAWILQSWEQAATEHEATAIVDGVLRRVRVDRTFVVGNERWIVDYKTAALPDVPPGTTRKKVEQPAGEPPRLDLDSVRESFLVEQVALHRDQLLMYREVLSRADRQYPIRLALYYPRFLGWIEVVP
ncbi:MAG: UvrD-helicase domain-containing protein [Planctomycetota bacterium]